MEFLFEKKVNRLRNLAFSSIFSNSPYFVKQDEDPNLHLLNSKLIFKMSVMMHAQAVQHNVLYKKSCFYKLLFLFSRLIFGLFLVLDLRADVKVHILAQIYGMFS